MGVYAMNEGLAIIHDSPMKTLRAKDLSGVYFNPSKELNRLASDNRVVRLAHGVYMAVPPEYVGLNWFPPPYLAAIGWATAMYGNRVPVLSGISAARFHHAIPRELSLAMVSAPAPRRPVPMDDGTLLLVSARSYDALETQLAESPFGKFRVTTPQQTLEDLQFLIRSPGKRWEHVLPELESACSQLQSVRSQHRTSTSRLCDFRHP